MSYRVPAYEMLNRGGFLSVKEVAGRLQIHWQTVLKYIKQGDLYAVQIAGGYRVREDWLDEFIEKNMVVKPKRKNDTSSNLRES